MNSFWKVFDVFFLFFFFSIAKIFLLGTVYLVIFCIKYMSGDSLCFIHFTQMLKFSDSVWNLHKKTQSYYIYRTYCLLLLL